MPDAPGSTRSRAARCSACCRSATSSATLTINGAELKDYLETAVSSLPATGNGRFGQVSGLCFTFDIEGGAGHVRGERHRDPRHGQPGRRAPSARRPTESCTGAPISFSAGVNYTLTTNDFTASGGDGYPNFRSRMTTQDILDQDLADYLAAQPGGSSAR